MVDILCLFRVSNKLGFFEVSKIQFAVFNIVVIHYSFSQIFLVLLAKCCYSEKLQSQIWACCCLQIFLELVVDLFSQSWVPHKSNKDIF